LIEPKLSFVLYAFLFEPPNAQDGQSGKAFILFKVEGSIFSLASTFIWE